MSEENLAVFKARKKAAGVDTETLMRYIRIFSGTFRAAVRVAEADSGGIAFIGLTTPSMEQNLDSILQRITLLEQKMQNAGQSTKAGVPCTGSRRHPSKTAVVERRLEPKTVSLPPAQYEDLMRDAGKNGDGLRP